MIIQVQQLIKYAMQDIGVLAKQEAPKADEISDGLATLNMMMGGWSVRSLMVLGAVLESFPLIPGKTSYTIGIGDDFNTTRPSAITVAFIRDGYNSDTPLQTIELDVWASIPDKDISTARPEVLYYDPGITQQSSFMGICSFYPTPDASTPYKLFMGEQKPLTEFVNFTDVVSFQPAYYEALRYNLAVRLWLQYHEDGRPVSMDIKKLANDSMKSIETMNSKTPTATIEVSGRAKAGSNYNILTGEYR